MYENAHFVIIYIQNMLKKQLNSMFIPNSLTWVQKTFWQKLWDKSIEKDRKFTSTFPGTFLIPLKRLWNQHKIMCVFFTVLYWILEPVWGSYKYLLQSLNAYAQHTEYFQTLKKGKTSFLANNHANNYHSPFESYWNSNKIKNWKPPSPPLTCMNL
jgi:hypothetical protein